ncbi:MAG TPA: hypothetical protein VJ836_00805 [Candidatus Saccharimonadales bacterium]|nr:hypothetical protein [Candidatus Saccharimonadales bacterium]
MGIRLDQVSFTTTHESPKNYATYPSSIVVPADTIPNGSSQNYVSQVAYARAGTRADIYLNNATKKVLANSGARMASQVYTPISGETAAVQVLYDATTVAVVLSISNNTGAAITLISQTITVTIVAYDAPITAI